MLSLSLSLSLSLLLSRSLALALSLSRSCSLALPLPLPLSLSLTVSAAWQVPPRPLAVALSLSHYRSLALSLSLSLSLSLCLTFPAAWQVPPRPQLAETLEPQQPPKPVSGTSRSLDPRDWYSIAEQPAPAPHLAHTEGRAGFTHIPWTPNPTVRFLPALNPKSQTVRPTP